MNNEKAAALLEIVSFFFVGIDFYGSDRLRKAQDRLIRSSECLRDRINSMQNFEWKKSRANRFMLVIYLSSALTTAFLLEFWGGFFSAITTVSAWQLIGGV